jgi:CheY-like chemotaxis protein
VDTIDNATEAIRLLQKERYDLVLMDIQMPVMDGVTATRCIRALPNAVKDIPIIAITGNVLPQQVREFLDAGMNDHIGKPFDGTKLCNSVRRWLRSAEGREVSGARNSPLSEVMKYEGLVGALDVSGAVRAPTKFVDQLSAANNFHTAESTTRGP